MAFNSPNLRALRFYRVLIVLPYAMPAFAMLLVWRDMFNQDFGLINQIAGLDVNWFGQTWTARAADPDHPVLAGLPVHVPGLPWGAAVDPAGPDRGRRRWTAPSATRPSGRSSSRCCWCRGAAAHHLVRVQLQQLQHHRLTTDGGPFPPDNPRAGDTDILVSLVYKLAFAAGGAQYGFAAAVSILIFLIVATVSIIGFRRTAALEEINR